MDINWKETLDYVSKIATVLTGVVALYFGFKDRARNCKVTIQVGKKELPIISDGAGGLINCEVPGIEGFCINTGKATLDIESIVVIVNNHEIECFPHSFFPYNYSGSIPMKQHLEIESERKRNFFFEGNEVIEKSGEFLKKKIQRIQVKIKLENTKKYKSNKLLIDFATIMQKQ